MKKTLKTIFVLTLVSTLVAFAPPVEKKEVKKSSITWLGKKVTGEHSGTIGLKSGYIQMNGDKMTGGEFVIDMTTLTVTDLQGICRCRQNEAFAAHRQRSTWAYRKPSAF